jgi:hypothetical protein
MPVNPRDLLPRHKSDVANAQAIVALGYPAVAPVLRDLLEWLQDCNWPISRPIGDFLATLPEQTAPLIWDVLRGNDDTWKYWCIVRLVSAMPVEIAEQFRGELARLAERPTAAERSEELNEVARDAISTLWPSGDGGAVSNVESAMAPPTLFGHTAETIVTDEFGDDWLRPRLLDCPKCALRLFRIDHSPMMDDYRLYCDRCPRAIEISF